MADTAKDLTQDRKIPGTLPGIIKDAMYHDIATVILSGQIKGRAASQNEICARFGISRHTLKNYLRHPEFVEVYTRLRDKHYEELADKLTDSKADPILREIAAGSEAMALYGDVVKTLREKIRLNRANSKDLKTAIDAYTAGYDRSPQGRKHKTGATLHLHQHTFTPSPEQAQVLQETEEELGLDMADVLDIRAVRVENTTPQEEDESTDASISQP